MLGTKDLSERLERFQSAATEAANSAKTALYMVAVAIVILAIVLAVK